MDKYYGIIYKVTNKINGKMYMGQTIETLSGRKDRHISSAFLKKYNMYFHKAIRKYGEENFKWEIIAKCNSLEKLNKAEIEMIEKYNTFKNGYNLTKGGGGSAGFKHTEETKKKISKLLKGNNNNGIWGKHRSKETKEKIGNANRGKTRSEKIKKKFSEMRKGDKNPFYGKHHTEETKKKQSEAKKGEKCYNYGKYGKENLIAKKYIVTTPEGKEIFVHGIADFCRNYKEEKLNDRHLIEVAREKRKQHKGYKCRYLEEEK